MITGSPATRSE